MMMMTKLKHVECRRRSHSPIRGLARLAPTGTNAAAQSGGGKIETRTRDFITAAIVVVFASKLEHCEFRLFWILYFGAVACCCHNSPDELDRLLRNRTNGVVCLFVRPSVRRAFLLGGGAQSLLLFFSSSLPRLVPQVTHCYSLQVAGRSDNTAICDSSLRMCQSWKLKTYTTTAVMSIS